MTIFRRLTFLFFYTFPYLIFSQNREPIIHILEESFYTAEKLDTGNFHHIQFSDRASFIMSQFNRVANFNSSVFMKEADFGGANFKNVANFGHGLFWDLVDFTGSKFEGKVSFESAEFFTNAEFQDTYFYLEPSFKYAKFVDNVNFNQAHFNTTFKFSPEYYPDTLFFMNVELIEKATFSKSIPYYEDVPPPFPGTRDKGKPVIYLNGTSLDMINFSLDDFVIGEPNDVDLNEASFVSTNNVYRDLLIKLRNNGNEISYAVLDKKYKAFKYLKNPDNKKLLPLLSNRALNFIDRHWWGYGYNKGLIVRNTIILFGFFFIMNWMQFRAMISDIYRIESIQNAFSDKGWFKIETIVLAFFYTALIFFGLKVSTDKLNFKFKIGALYLLLQYVIGLICLAYLVDVIVSSPQSGY